MYSSLMPLAPLLCIVISQHCHLGTRLSIARAMNRIYEWWVYEERQTSLTVTYLHFELSTQFSGEKSIWNRK